MPYSCCAVVASPPGRDGQPSFGLEDLSLRDIQDDECLVEIIATGICHTDIAVASRPDSVFPRVLGHESAGYIKRLGAKVGSDASPSKALLREGDPVLLSYPFCGECSSCQSGHPAYCLSALALSFGNAGGTYTRPSDATTEAGASVAGGFFGQSSLATLAVVKECCIVNLAGIVQHKEELRLFAPLGCAFQTGGASVSILAGTLPSDSVCIIGLGGVGLAGVMAAKILGCKTIIAIDRVEDKLQLAESLGATHIINNEICPDGLSQAVRDATNGSGSSITIDTTGFLPIIQEALDMTSVLGKMILLGMSRASIEIDITTFKLSGKTLVGSVQGDAIASKYIPQMIQWYREGKFPIGKLVKYYKASRVRKPKDINLALHDMKTGKTVKPIVVWEKGSGL